RVGGRAKSLWAARVRAVHPASSYLQGELHLLERSGEGRRLLRTRTTSERRMTAAKPFLASIRIGPGGRMPPCDRLLGPTKHGLHATRYGPRSPEPVLHGARGFNVRTLHPRQSGHALKRTSTQPRP